MEKKEHFVELLRKTVKLAVLLVALYAAGWFIDLLPFARDLPFLSDRLSAAGFLGALVSLLVVIAVLIFGSDVVGPVDALLESIPRAGDLAGNLVRIAVILYAYGAFRPGVLPFIPDYEWAYQALFLGFTLFFLARAGLLVYAASESISACILKAVNPYRPELPRATGEPPQTLPRPTDTRS